MPDPRVFDPFDDAQVEPLLERYALQLHEHGFDSVRIFVTARNAGGESVGRTAQAGQYYAGLGWVTEWLDREKARTAAAMRAEYDEDGDS